MSTNQSSEQSNIVNIHDPFFLWGLLEHSDERLIQSIGALKDEDLSRLYWSCYFHQRTAVCDGIRKKSQSIQVEQDAIDKLSALAKKAKEDQPDLSDIQVPFRLPTSPDFLVKELTDASYIPSKGKPLKFTAVNDRGEKKM